MNRSETMKQKWNDPEFRKNQIKAMKRAWRTDPERKTNLSLFMMGKKGDEIRQVEFDRRERVANGS